MTSTGGARPLAITYGEYDGMQPERAIIDRMDDDVVTVAIYFTKPPTHTSARNPQERHLTRLEEVPPAILAAFTARPCHGKSCVTTHAMRFSDS